MSKKIELTADEKWDLVRRHYENSYKDPITRAYIRFRKKPEPLVINYLFTQMIKLYDAEFEYKRVRDKKD